MRSALASDHGATVKALHDEAARPGATEGYIARVTDSQPFPSVGSARIGWLDPPTATVRRFVTAHLGRAPLEHWTCGAVLNGNLSEGLAAARAATLGLLNDARSTMSGLNSPPDDGENSLLYLECADWSTTSIAESIADVRTTILNTLGLNGRGYDWRHPAVVRNIIGFPAGTEELRFEDILLGLPHEHDPHKLPIPDIVCDLIMLKLLLYSWAPAMIDCISSASSVGGDFASALAVRGAWLRRSVEIRSSLRAVEAAPDVQSYAAGLSGMPLNVTTVRSDRWFLQRLPAELSETLANVHDQLAFREELSLADLAQRRHVYDLRIAEENIRLQRSVRWLTWAMLVMTAVLLLDSPTARSLTRRVSDRIAAYVTNDGPSR